MVTRCAPEVTQEAAPAARGRAALRLAAVAAVIAVLYLVYWRESWTVGANSDSASTALQAWDIVHGNILLHGWWMSDVSFYTTEIPQYVVLEAIFGLDPGVVHLAAAMTYVLIVVLAALLAKGRASGAEGLARSVLAGVIVMSPQASAALTLLLGPDHTGTVVPVLLVWLLIDRVRVTSRRVRWCMPLVVCILLTWVMTADSVVLFTAIAPLVIAAVVRALGALVRRGEPLAGRSGERLAGTCYELSLAAAALVAAGLGSLMPRIIAYLGGYTVWSFQTRTVPSAQFAHSAWDTSQAVLELFGADPFTATSRVELAVIWLHLAGVIAAVAALGAALYRFLREDSILVPGLAIAIGLETGAFFISIHSTNLDSVREMAAIMPFGGVLAGRLLAAPLLRCWRLAWLRRVLAPVSAIVLAGYLGSMVCVASRPPAPSVNAGLAAWLAAHHLTSGLGGYWTAGSVTLDTSGHITISGVQQGNGLVVPYEWETQASEYDPKLHDPTFVVVSAPPIDPRAPGLPAAAIRTFGPPAGSYRFSGYTVMVWHKNLLSSLR